MMSPCCCINSNIFKVVNQPAFLLASEGSLDEGLMPGPYGLDHLFCHLKAGEWLAAYATHHGYHGYYYN